MRTGKSSIIRLTRSVLRRGAIGGFGGIRRRIAAVHGAAHCSLLTRRSATQDTPRDQRVVECSPQDMCSPHDPEALDKPGGQRVVEWCLRGRDGLESV